MRGRSIVTRVVFGTVLVALLCTLVLAATAAMTTGVLWRSWEIDALEGTADAFVRAMSFEASEDRISLVQAGQAAMEESSLSGYRFEIWRGGELLAPDGGGEASSLGPPIGKGSRRRNGWLICERPLAGGLSVILGYPESAGIEVRRVFTRSVLVSLPPSLLLAIVIGRLVGSRATRPIVEFKERVSGISGLDPLGPSTFRILPAEVHDLEGSFHDLLSRLREAVSREAEFAANASHELRTPLTSIRLKAERAFRSSEGEARRQIEAQIEEIDRMVRLIDSLLVMARDARSGIPRGEVVNLSDLTRDIASRVLPFPRATMDVPDEALVAGDEDLLSIAIENLLDNARKFTAAGESVRLTLRQERQAVVLRVTSPGSRVPEDKRERLFERFYRDAESRSASPGHGLGLPLTRHIARLHGGDVSCVSASREDACFALSLPAWHPTPEVLSGQSRA